MVDKHPTFPDVFNGYNVVWGQGNNVIQANLIARIPGYTQVDKENEPERYEALYNAFWDREAKTYQEAKEIYDSNVFVGTIFTGNTEVTCKITKIVISHDKQYVCYKASDEYEAIMAEKNRTDPPPLNPGAKYHFKPGRFGLTTFISLINNKQITILSTPIHGKDKHS